MATDPNPFALKQLKNDADKLANVDASVASMVKSAISAYEWDSQNAHYWVRNACLLSNDAVTHLNAAVTFRVLNDFDASAKYAQMAIDRAPYDAVVIEDAIDVMMMAGMLSQAKSATDRLPHVTDNLSSLNSTIEKLLEVLNILGVSETELQSDIRTALQVAMERRTRVFSVTHSVGHDPDGGINYFVPVSFRGSISDELALEGELAERLAKNANWDPLKLSVEFTYDET